MQPPFNAIHQRGGAAGVSPSLPSPTLTPPRLGEASPEQAASFSSLLGKAIGEVNAVMDEVIQTTPDLISGRLENLHDMTVAGVKAEVMLHLTTKIASKLASATTTLFQMQL